MGRTVLPRDGLDLSIDGESVHYVEQGTGDALVLIHGFPSCARLTYGRLLSLLPSDRRVVAVDLVGLGWSDRYSTQPCDPQAQAPRILKVMDALGIDRATVVGSSFGGAVAQHVALAAPERVDRLVLLASVDANDPPQSWSKEWLFAAGIVSLLTAMRFPWIGSRLRLKVGKPYTGWSTSWGEPEALDAMLPGAHTDSQRTSPRPSPICSPPHEPAGIVPVTGHPRCTRRSVGTVAPAPTRGPGGTTGPRCSGRTRGSWAGRVRRVPSGGRSSSGHLDASWTTPARPRIIAPALRDATRPPKCEFRRPCHANRKPAPGASRAAFLACSLEPR